jgi:hypothetical protein
VTRQRGLPRLISTISALSALSALSAVSGCDVESTSEPGACGALDGAPGQRGVVVIDTDYASTSVQVIGWDGSPRLPSLISSGSRVAGLSAALSGDVMPPFASPQRGELVLLDKKASALTWIDLGSCGVRGQLSVGDGFWANPYDYLEVTPSKAYVARNNDNPSPTAGPLDLGGDVLVIDPRRPSVTSSISLDGGDLPPGARPHPAKLIAWEHGADRAVLALLQGFPPSGYDTAASAVLVGIDPGSDERRFSVVVDGVKNCNAAVAMSDGSGRVLLGCSGVIDQNGISLEAHTSALVVLGPKEGGGLEVLSRISADDLGGQPLSFFLDEVSSRLALVGSFGNLDAGVGDRWLLVDLESGSLVQTVATAGTGFVLGGVACQARPSGTWCLGADGEVGAGKIRRFRLEADRLIEEAPSPAVDAYGLKPRYFGKL